MFFAPNPKQKSAIEHERGPMLVVAGAGTGKTTVLVQRVARLVSAKLAAPDEVLCVTYMRNAARELKERIAAETGASPEKIQAYTIHGYCEGVLRRAGQDFKHVEKEDLWIYLRQNIQELKLLHFSKARDPGLFLRDLLELFERCNDELKTSVDYSRYVEHLRKGDFPLPRVGKFKKGSEPTRDETLARCDEIARVFGKVESIMESKGWMTYGQMVPATIKVLSHEPVTLEEERARARFILIDEFQDCNRGQIELLSLLAGSETNIFAVGDPDQAIYRFRGATSAAFEEFLTLYPESRGVVLNENQRSRAPILGCAYALISENPGITIAAGTGDSFARILPTSVRDAKLPAPMQPVRVALGIRDETEANEVAACIEQLLPTPASDPKKPRFGVLYRQHSHSGEIVAELARRQIPFVVRGTDVLQTREVRDLQAVLRVLVSPFDGGSLFRVCGLPRFDIEPAEIQEFLKGARGKVPLGEYLASSAEGKKVLAALEESRRNAARSGWKALTVARETVSRFGFGGSSEALSIFLEFIAVWEKKPVAAEGKLIDFLLYLDYLPEAGGGVRAGSEDDPDAEPGVVRLMSAHAAKGLEFEHVFILRANSGSFPAANRDPLFEVPSELRASTWRQGDGKQVHDQEERRLFYVAMTRARDTLTICAKPGKGANPLPTGLLRNLLQDKRVRPSLGKNPTPDQPDVLVQRSMRSYNIASIEARANEMQETSKGISTWLLCPPSSSLAASSLSASAIERYDTCPLKFKIEREWDVPGPAAAGMLYGSIAHEVLKDYYDAIVAGKPRSSEQVLGLFAELMRKAPFDDAHQRDLFMTKGRSELAEFVAVQGGKPVPTIIATEQTFSIKLGETRVTGRIDRMDDLGSKRVRIIDYKTGSPQDEKKAKHSLQLSLYALAAQETWGYHPEKLVLYNLEDQSEVETSREPVELQAVRDKVQEVAMAIAAGDFFPTPGYHCGRCDYFDLCPATEQRLYSIATAQAAVGKN